MKKNTFLTMFLLLLNFALWGVVNGVLIGANVKEIRIRGLGVKGMKGPFKVCPI